MRVAPLIHLHRSPDSRPRPLLAIVAIVWLAATTGHVSAETTVWSPSDNPHILTDDFIVGEGELLTILPGTEVRLAAGVSLWVDGGRLDAVGTPDSLIMIRWNVPGDHWGAIRFNASANNRMTHVFVQGGSFEDDDHGGMMEVEYESSIIVDDCEFTNYTHDGFLARYGSRFMIIDSYVHNGQQRGIVQNTQAKGHVIRCRVENVNLDGIEADGGGDPFYVLISDSVVHDVGDDGIDLDAEFIGRLDGNTIYSCGDKGVSVSSDASATVINCVVYDCFAGIVGSGGGYVEVASSTIYGCDYGLRAYMVSGYSGGTVDARNVVVWETAVSAD